MRLLSALLAAALLAGCAAVPKLPPERSRLRDFALEARFALRVTPPDRAPRSSGGLLSWEHDGRGDRLLLSSPLGIGLAEIDMAPGLARLRTADGRRIESADPESLTEEVTGQRLPVGRLSDWLLGRTTAGGTLERDAAGRPARLSEAGWQIDYAYADAAPDAPPSALTLNRAGEIELKLRIESWRELP
ncbi:lipoprotein insertase outer membrane protein LolB [Azonexus sp.]|uniref:lipoprotein insertase outer membrane protein LolB n=1 Tax=Azonexus sp. TaxID=1872668 RepID=UPI0035B2659B